MQPNAYFRPDDRELLRAALRQLSGRFRSAVLFAGLASSDQMQLTDFLGTATSSLHHVVVVPGAGLGGRVLTQRQPFLVENYIASKGITHEYDLAVRRELLTSVAAVPVVVQGTSRAVLYIASRDRSPLGESVVREATEASTEMAEELRVRDEVDRRVSILDTARAEPARTVDRSWLEHVREAHAELRSLAGTVSDPELARQLDLIGGHLAPPPAHAVHPTVRLARRELDVLAQVALGCSYQETADRLGLKAVTVKSYLQNAMTKLSAHNRLEAVSSARRLGLIP
ncbi:LuxR C-terminal-related transcriptional regulator [Arthrobacter sp. NtRootA1]|uniref:LuxR C-terminal-related transcriptional regulator n=1 Tax=Arthrobacter sp. NtRootA1 TaxID=2830983 RepID=UPI001CC3D682|nr:LuxR C-terminal-related transcriptional regulator [Arthrobacter sp. NtRootA1]BCW05704.1 helix-turn-helix transcriptional regulator [Arthrobacter sp. NtRootA1]